MYVCLTCALHCAKTKIIAQKRLILFYGTTAVTNSEDLSGKTAEGPSPHEDPSGFYSSLQVRCVVSALAKEFVWCKSDKENGVLVSLTKMRDKSHPATLIRPSSLLVVSLCTVYFHYFCTLAIRSHLPHTVVSKIVASNKNTFIFSTFELSSFLSQREEGPVLIHTA